MVWFSNLLEILPGLGFVAPVVAGALALFKWGLSRHDVQFSRRREFLLHWKDPRELDALSVEVLTRQLTGTYLPAIVVRRVCARDGDETAQSLIRLATMWSLVEWDAKTGTARWRSRAGTKCLRSAWRGAVWIGYFSSFIVGAGLIAAIALEMPSPSVGLTGAGWGVALLFAAYVALVRTGAWGAACAWGEDLLHVANKAEATSTNQIKRPKPGCGDTR